MLLHSSTCTNEATDCKCNTQQTHNTTHVHTPVDRTKIDSTTKVSTHLNMGVLIRMVHAFRSFLLSLCVLLLPLWRRQPHPSLIARTRSVIESHSFPRAHKMFYGPLSHSMLVWSVLCCSCLLLLAITAQEQCRFCSRLITKTSNRTHICLECRKQQEHQAEQASSAAAAASSPSTISPASPPSPFFDSPPTSHSHLSVGQRWAIITLHKEGHDHSYIAQRIPCDVKSVRRWIAHHEQHHTVDDEPRSG